MKSRYTLNIKFKDKAEIETFKGLANFEITTTGFLFIKFPPEFTEERPGGYIGKVQYFKLDTIENMNGTFDDLFDTEEERKKFEVNLNG